MKNPTITKLTKITHSLPYSSLFWNNGAQMFVNAKGRFVSKSDVRDIVDNDLLSSKVYLQTVSLELKSAAQEFNAGKITHDEYIVRAKDFRDKVGEELYDVHLAALVSAKGGFRNMTAEDLDKLDAIMKPQLEYLNVFSAQSAMYPDYVLTGGFDARLALYPEAARHTFEVTAREGHEKAGFVAMSNILEAGADHCIGHNSCIEMTAKGVVAINDPTYLVTGERICLVNCKCKTKYYKKWPKIEKYF